MFRFTRWFRAAAPVQELTLDRIFGHLADIQAKVAVLDLNQATLRPRDADLLNDVLTLLDIDFRALTGDAEFWGPLREMSRAGKPIFTPYLSSSNNQLLTSIQKIIKEKSGSTAEADHLIRLVHSLAMIGNDRSAEPATVYSVRPQFAYQSYNATLAHETFRETYDIEKVGQEQSRNTAKTAAQLVAFLGICAAAYGFAVDALSAGQVFERLQQVGIIVGRLDPDFPTGNRPSDTGPGGPGSPGPSAAEPGQPGPRPGAPEGVSKKSPRPERIGAVYPEEPQGGPASRALDRNRTAPGRAETGNPKPPEQEPPTPRQPRTP